MNITRFTGLNNVISEERLRPEVARDGTATSALVEATNVDIDLDRAAIRRQGLQAPDARAHAWVWEAPGFLLAVVDGDLVSIVGTDYTTLHADIGTDRIWYCNWPDGRVAYTNSTVAGLATAAGVTPWGVPSPDISDVTATPGTDGLLPAGGYRWGISYVRTSDKLEGGVTLSDSLAIAATGSLALTDLPTLDGYSINVYLTHHNGAVFKLAGNTETDSFTYAYGVEKLIRDTLTENMDPAPAGILTGWWRGHSYVAIGNTLFGSKYTRPEHFDLEKDHKPFSGDITMVQPVEAGLFVGTTKQLAFVRGTNWDDLALEKTIWTPCTLGSGVTVPGKYLVRGDSNAGQGDCALFIAGGLITAGYQDGSTAALTEGKYRTAAAHVSATFRLRDQIPQYIAVPI